jgi:catechol 2,3-dioxygenase-like lactoylglutathione lyase family enzyme
MAIRSFDHVGVVVDDLEAVTDFFLALGFERAGEAQIEGDWVDQIVGLSGVRSELVTVRAPDGSGTLELTKFHSPSDEASPELAPANRFGLRHIAYIVDNLDAVLARLVRGGIGLVGDVVTYEKTFRLCYVRGPEGLIIELAEPIENPG